jgi:hypothetical protein
VVLVLLVATACNEPHVAEYPKRVPTPGQAKLPPTPDLEPPAVPERHPDGAWSVKGFLGAKKDALAGAVQVRGTVAALYPCAPQETVCKPAPHLWLTDSRSGVGRRLLVGGERDIAARGWSVGQELTLAGAFATASPDGLYFAPSGMLLLSPVTPTDDAGTHAKP